MVERIGRVFQCSKGQHPGERARKYRIGEALLRGFAEGHIEQALQLFAEDLDFQHPMPQSIWPWAGRRSGRQGLAEFSAGLGQTIEVEQFEPANLLPKTNT